MRDEERIEIARKFGEASGSKLISKFGTRNVFRLAAALGLSVEYARWPLVTVGEFDVAAAKIIVNLSGLDMTDSPDHTARAIIAHELGHAVVLQEQLPGQFNNAEHEHAAAACASVIIEECNHSKLTNSWRKAYDRSISGH